MKAEEIRHAIKASPLAGEVEAIMKWMRPAVRLHSERTNFKEMPFGASRMGGLPDLPHGVGWPANSGNDQRPLEFLAQIDLGEVARVSALPDFPALGWFAIFYDLEAGSWGSDEEDLGAWRVVYFAGEADKLIRAKPGAGEIKIFQPCAVSFEREDCLPDPSDQLPGFDGWIDSHWDAYWNLVKQPELDSRQPHHRLGGHPMLVQNGIDGGGGWDFLLHLDSDDDGPDWMWGDAGRLYFWMCRGCREVGSLEHVWSTLECY